MPAEAPRRRERCAVLGLGRIGRTVARRLAGATAGPELTAIVTRGGVAARETVLQDVPVHARISDVLGAVDVVVECATPDVLAREAPAILASGADLVAISVSAFAGPDEARLLAAAEAGPGRLHIASGAACALPLLRVARQAGLDRVLFRQIYRTEAWARLMPGAPADAFSGVFFAGSARAAARRFPLHLNAAVGVALAGLGLDETQVELVGSHEVRLAYELELESMGAPIRLGIGPYGGETENADHTAFSILSMLAQRGPGLRF